jgi:hypothetical protein
MKKPNKALHSDAYSGGGRSVWPCHARLVNEALRVGLLVAVILTGGCGQQSSSSRAPDPMASAVAPTPAQLIGFSRQTGIPIPTTAESVRFHSESGGPDSAMWLQFRLPAAQFQQFIKSSPIPQTEVRRDALMASSALGYFRAWLPAAPKNYQYADTQIAPGRCVKCIFDFDDPQTATVYIMWFET